MNERPTKTFYITIDAKNGQPNARDTEADAIAAAKDEYWAPLNRKPFRVDITEAENGKPHFEFTELEEPKPDYWVQRWAGQPVVPLAQCDTPIHIAYIKDDTGNLIILNDEEKAKVIEEWKTS